MPYNDQFASKPKRKSTSSNAYAARRLEQLDAEAGGKNRGDLETTKRRAAARGRPLKDLRRPKTSE